MSDKINDRLVNFFIDYGLPYTEIGENMWTLKDELENIDNIVVHYEDPLLIFRVKMMELPDKNKEEFFEKLLKFNAERLVHGAYAIEGNNVVIIDTLEAENLDYNEFVGTVDAIILALTQDYDELKTYL
jgi:uncharacterized glyoxalase superfamily protein PhnB